MPLEIIGAGFGRTGTFSLYQALEKLGYPTHHFFKIAATPEQDPTVWIQAYDNKETYKWETVYGDYRAAVDWPTAAYYKELYEYYPDARVILTVRSAESWFKSIHNTLILHALQNTTDAPQFTVDLVKLARHVTFDGLWEKDPQKLYDKEYMLNYFNAHTDKVKQIIPADRLLVYELGSGWEPLCKFLGKEIPDEPYPHLNDSESFRARVLDS